MKRIDEAVGRIMVPKFKRALFENHYVDVPGVDFAAGIQSIADEEGR